MDLVCKWQIRSPYEDEKLNCRAYPEHPQCNYGPKDVSIERVCGKADHYITGCSHFTPVDGIERLLEQK